MNTHTYFLGAALLFSGVYAENSAELPIVIVTASYNNAEWYKWNLDSVFDQKYENWHLIYMEDCSPDGTGVLVKEYVKERGFEAQVTVVCNDERYGAMANQYTAIHACEPAAIIVILDGDDRFAYDGVLQTVNQMYSTDDVWLTYGQFSYYPCGELGFCASMPTDIIERNAFREHSWVTSHLRTFYAGLFQKIKLEDLLYEDYFFPMAPDVAIMMPMLEMARDHLMFCPILMLEYNAVNPLNEHRISRDLQMKCDEIIRSRDKYEKIESPF